MGGALKASGVQVKRMERARVGVGGVSRSGAR
jgi:hypothetical protein